MEHLVQWIPVRAAAKALCCSRQRIHRLIKRGHLSCVNYQGTVLVSMASIKARKVAMGLMAPVEGVEV